MKLSDYTEIEYMCFSELKREFSEMQAHILFQKIEDYRKVYRKDLPNGYYIACDKLLKQVYRVYGLFLSYPKDEKDGRELLYVIVKKMPETLQQSIKTLFEKMKDQKWPQVMEQLQVLFQDEESNVYLLTDENVIFKILYVVLQYLQNASVYSFLLIALLLYKENLLKCLVLFQPKYLKELSFIDEHEDKTYAYFEILAWLEKQFQKGVIRPIDTTSVEQWLEYYPFLQKGQVAFYLEHRKPNCYYTIQQYMDCNDVCYETGRVQMAQLVSLGWYKKKKVGKKFVYSI